ncbi:hypothetical protein SAMN04488499_100378 [Sporomusa acidovorans]|nr:hypothetical protein SPACI_32180 [Sporomusa acidovorans DSM 3132]SDD68234.1 hypothetical protein SAMN04488499_100378 [Sporomusa acidovorans]
MWILFFMNLFVIIYVINIIAKLKANEEAEYK